MDTKKYNWVLYLITATILVTIAVQLYWNYKNYQENKQHVTSDIQTSLDTAIEEYYSKIFKENSVVLQNSNKVVMSFRHLDSLAFENDGLQDSIKREEIIEKEIIIRIKKMKDFLENTKMFDGKIIIDTAFRKGLSRKQIEKNIRKIKVYKNVETLNEALNSNIEFTKLDSLINLQLQKRDIETSHYLLLFEKDSLIKSNLNEQDTLPLFINSKSTYLGKDKALKMYYNLPVYKTFYRSLGGIFISLVLSLTIIVTLFYLLKIINKQKELAEIKNDLISNITHEFKTPIATVSTAIEALENFNAIDDKEKTKKYLSMSSSQLKRLHQMVEKLLETATLDSEKLILQKESIDLVSLVERIVNKHKLIGTEKKSLRFATNIDILLLLLDPFHIENAISNLIDNALKYGGEHVEVTLQKLLNSVQIIVADDGKGIEKNQQEKIFDKFYRVPKGNTHDVKGFGIGLYYTKKIVEKHKGFITLSSSKHQTIFTITLAYES